MKGFFRLSGFLFHGATTSIIAYGIATKRVPMFYLIAVALHFSNNFLAFVWSSFDPAGLFGLWLLGGYAVMFVTLYLSWRLYNRTSERIAT